MSRSASPSPGPPPVRLVASDRSHPFAPGRETVMARVQGDGLRAFDVRDGDHVVLARRERAEHGDLAVVIDPGGEAHLWKVYPEGEGYRLSMGYPSLERRSEMGARVQAVVVGVLRNLRMPEEEDEDRPPSPK